MTLFSRFVATGYYKKILMAMCLCFVVFAGSGVVRGQGLGVGDQKPGVSLLPDCCGDIQYFKDFTIRLKDNNRKDRILICDVAIELNQGMKLPKERARLRKIIYKVLKELSGSSEIRKGLKKTIKIRLNNFMGDETIKKVYVIKFVLL